MSTSANKILYLCPVVVGFTVEDVEALPEPVEAVAPLLEDEV